MRNNEQKKNYKKHTFWIQQTNKIQNNNDIKESKLKKAKIWKKKEKEAANGSHIHHIYTYTELLLKNTN